MIVRREMLRLSAGAFGAIGAAYAQDGRPVDNGTVLTPFSPTMPLDIARSIAKSPYRPPASDLPDAFSGLTFEQYVGVRRKPASRVWGDENLGFIIEPLHRGFLFNAPMQIYIVEDGPEAQAQLLAYRPEDYDFGGLKLPTTLGNLGFSGFRVLRAAGDRAEELAVFQGASFFRARAPGQPPGVVARALALKTGDARGEEFPIFRAMWVVKPQVGANVLTIYGLIDSESMTGAYRFTLRPAEATIIDAELTLIPRVSVDHIGIASMSGASLSTPLDKRRPEDVRPMIAEVNGLQLQMASGEWIWRPVSNRATLQISSFVGDNPKGFGFLMRDRNFADYQDDESKWHLRPSLWIEPLADFGAGSIALVEIPAESESNSNCIAYWRPSAGIGAGKEVSYAYRQFWCWEPPVHPPNLIVRSARSGKTGSKRRRFIVTFSGESLGDDKATPDLKPVLSANPGSLHHVKFYVYRDLKFCRVAFDLEPGSEPYSEMRLVIESAGAPISETWLYRWTA